MVMQNFGGDKKIMVFSKLANWIRLLNYDVWRR